MISWTDRSTIGAYLAGEAQRRASELHRWDPMHQSFADMRLFLEELTAEEGAT